MSLPGVYNRRVVISPIERPQSNQATPVPPPSLQAPTGPSSPPSGDFNAQYGGGSAPLRNALGFSQTAQQDIDLLEPFRHTAEDGSISIDSNNPQLQQLINDGYVSYESNGLGGDQAAMVYRMTGKMPQTVFGDANQI